MSEQLALQLYRRMVAGETQQQIAEDLGIPLERIQLRLRAAARHMNGRGLDESVGSSTTTVSGDEASAVERGLKYCRICGEQTWRQALSFSGFDVDVGVCVSCIQRALTLEASSDDLTH